MTMSPDIKFELSPTESLIEQFEGSSSDGYSSLFGAMDHNTLNPSEIDGSEYDYGDYERFETMTGSDANISMTGSPQPQQDKKAVKKRKSWGQQLPEPKTNLPPRYDDHHINEETILINAGNEQRLKTRRSSDG